METALILISTVLAASFLLSRPMARLTTWRAAMTPLASIIGSGFLVLGPILDASYGLYAPMVMGALCLGAWLFGAAVRYNIAEIEDHQHGRSQLERDIEKLASWSLAFAYIISVAYYLNLFGAFCVSLTPMDDPFSARTVTSAVLVLILIIGWTRGFAALEHMEQISVGIKLAIITGLLTGLVLQFGRQMGSGELVVKPAVETGWSGVALAFGLIVTVQGFESSRYLGTNYDARTRIRSMKLAQLVSTVIYMAYIGLLSFLFQVGSLELTETAIIGMMEVVAPILPLLLVAAALSAQFSAAVADTGGSGGLIAELSQYRVSARQGYALLVTLGLILTWTANVFEIISYASRAFALYYALQALIAAVAAWRHSPSRRMRAFGFLLLTLLGISILVFGQSVE